MNKIKVTQKFINDNFKNIICVGYCDLCFLLKCKEVDYYTSGVYGWNADIYKINNNTVIVTGYRPFGNITSNKLNINKKYNEKARTICNDYTIDYKKQTKKLEKLLEKYIEKCLQKKEVC